MHDQLLQKYRYPRRGAVIVRALAEVTFSTMLESVKTSVIESTETIIESSVSTRAQTVLYHVYWRK